MGGDGGAFLDDLQDRSEDRSHKKIGKKERGRGIRGRREDEHALDGTRRSHCKFV
jgi:hypothetical protein